MTKQDWDTIKRMLNWDQAPRQERMTREVMWTLSGNLLKDKIVKS